MKRILLLFGFLLSLAASAQVETSITVAHTANPTPTWPALLYLPPDYAGTTTNYPLIIFAHGSGESCPPLSNIYNSVNGGPSYFIERGKWPADGGWINPRDGQKYKCIVVSPQSGCNNWSASGDDLDYITQYMVSHYRIDTTRIYHTGFSAGAGGDVEYAAHIVNNGNENLTTATRRWKPAAYVIMSPATNNPPSSWANVMVPDSSRYWFFGDQNGDTYGAYAYFMGRLQTSGAGYLNTLRSGISWFSGNPGDNGIVEYHTGHGPVTPFYDTAYHETFTFNGVTATMNIYEWMLINTQGLPPTTPTASAGNPQTISLPTSSVTLTGSGTAGAGHTIASYAWSQVSGPASTIASPSASTTVINGITVSGTYVYQLKVTNNIGAFATSTVTITVNANNVQAGVSPGVQTITLPTNSVVLDGSVSTGVITSYAWSLFSGPNSPTILTPSASSTTITGLIQGSYLIRLAVNGGTSTFLAAITVNAAPTGCGSGTKYTPVPGSDSGVYISSSAATAYNPGDTIVLSKAYGWNYFEIDGFHGNPACPLVIINGTGQTKLRQQIKLASDTYVKVTGTGDPTVQYGLMVEYDPQLRYQTGAAVVIDGKSKGDTVENCILHNVDIGIVCETNEDCDTTFDYPNWTLDSMVFHHNKIVGTWNEGMYIGNTSPDNASYDLRPVVCNGVTYYYAPMKNGLTKIYDNIVDSTGRGGIQLANAAVGVSEIYNNTVSHNGLNGDDAQGTAISVGLYTRAYIHDNNIDYTYTWGIGSLGGGATNIPLRIENNHINHSGGLAAYNLATTSRTVYDPRSEPTSAPVLSWPQSIEVDTRGSLYTTDTPNPGTAVPGTDSTIFWVKGNVVGISNGNVGVNLEDNHAKLQKSGSVVCNNVNLDGSPAIIVANNSEAGGTINYTTNCGASAPSVSASTSNASITLPTNFVTLTGTATPSGSATISTYSWSELSGPSTFTFSTPAAASNLVTNMVQGTYVFKITATDSNGLTGSATVTVVVNPSSSPTITAGKVPVGLKRRTALKH